MYCAATDEAMYADEDGVRIASRLIASGAHRSLLSDDKQDALGIVKAQRRATADREGIVRLLS